MGKSTFKKLGKQETAATDASTLSQEKEESRSSISSSSNEHPNLSPMSSHILPHGSQSSTPKVPIARLPRQSEEQKLSRKAQRADKNRVTHACEPCRHRKTKCSGERPACQHCQDFNLTCTYADGKRDKIRKQLDDLAGKVEEYERLLQDISPRVGGWDHDMIRRALDRRPVSDDDSTLPPAGPRWGRRDSQELPGEQRLSGRAGSQESMDRISEDYNQGAKTRATGFYGKTSELTWLQRLRRQAPSHDPEDSDESEEQMTEHDNLQSPEIQNSGPGLPPVSASSYHCDDMNLSLDGYINPYEIPNHAIANALFQSFLTTVHPLFPIIGRITFIHQYNEFLSHPEERKPNANWLAILNMIFAIGAKHSHLVRAEWAHDRNDHLVYFNRARKLGLNFDTILGHAELQNVQITGLMAFYLMAINQINRAWGVCGIAVRHATTLGLNLRNESKDVPDSSKEIRYRVWWAICSMERLLASMTGRPLSFAEKHCTAPLPLPVEEESFIGTQAGNIQNIRIMRRWSSGDAPPSESTATSTSIGSPEKKPSPSPRSPAAPQSFPENHKEVFPPCNALAFEYHAKLSGLNSEVMDRLYCAGGKMRSWAEIQATISSLVIKLEIWRQQLPSEFDFVKDQQDPQFASQRISLGFSYYSTLIIITRPCLCRMDRKIPDQSDGARAFNQEIAAKCVHAARDMLLLIADEPNAIGLCEIAPWWCLVHWLVEAATVSMLELSFRADHTPNEVEEVFYSAKKAIDWLQDMAAEDEAARRASKMCAELLRQVALKVGISTRGITTFQVDGEHSGESIRDMQDMQYSNPQSLYQSGKDVQSMQEPRASYPTLGSVQDRQTVSSHYQSHGDYFTSAPFQPQIFASYDQILPHGQMPTASSQVPADPMFLTDMGTGNMRLDSDAAGRLWDMDHDWLPDGDV